MYHRADIGYAATDTCYAATAPHLHQNATDTGYAAAGMCYAATRHRGKRGELPSHEPTLRNQTQIVAPVRVERGSWRGNGVLECTKSGQNNASLACEAHHPEQQLDVCQGTSLRLRC
eukprot:641591-Rhodomonas_salina.2